MTYNIIGNKRNINIKYTKLPVTIFLSWSILTSYAPIYYFYDINSVWKYGEILPVIIIFDSYTKQNFLYKCIDGKIMPLKTYNNNFKLFDNIDECTEYCLFSCMKKYSKYPEKYPSKIPYNINYKKIDRIYRDFQKAYKDFLETKELKGYIKITNN